MDPAELELRERLRESKEFKERVQLHLARSPHFDIEAALNREVDYYLAEGAYLREMAHAGKLVCCQYDEEGRCVICGGVELDNPHPNFR